jgi:hypothetical protein
MSTLQPLETQTDRDELRKPGLHLFSMPAQNAARNAIDRAPARAFLVLSLAYLAVTLSLSSLKLLWLDELITLHIARLPNVGAIWQALQRGVDPNPPVTHILVHFSRIVFGEHEFAYRLPAIGGYWVGLLSLFAYLKRRLPATWALAGTVLSMTMGAFEYSYESRSYGIFYGLAMLAFFCWSQTVDSSRGIYVRCVYFLGMIVALAASISTNYFAVLAFFPIAIGEVARTFVAARNVGDKSDRSLVVTRAALLRAIDLRVWIALAMAAATILLYRSMIAHSIAQFAPYAWNKVSLQQVADSYTEMVETILYPILGLFAVACIVYSLRSWIAGMCESCRTKILPRWLVSFLSRSRARLRVPAHEIAAVCVFMLYPVVGYVVASIRGGMLSPRFVIPVCFGFAMAATFVAYLLFDTLPHAATVMLCFLCAWFACRESFVGYWYQEQKQCFYKVVDRFPQAQKSVPADSPIVIPDPLLALTFQHYAPAALAAREVFPVDFPAIRAFRGDDSPEENLWAGRRLLYTLPIVPLATFVNTDRDYVIIAGDGNWMLQDLGRHNYATRRLPIDTRAQAIGGFTPLARGTPAYFIAGPRETLRALAYDDPCSPLLQPIPFRAADDLPNAGPYDPRGVAK